MIWGGGLRQIILVDQDAEEKYRDCATVDRKNLLTVYVISGGHINATLRLA